MTAFMKAVREKKPTIVVPVVGGMGAAVVVLHDLNATDSTRYALLTMLCKFY